MQVIVNSSEKESGHARVVRQGRSNTNAGARGRGAKSSIRKKQIAYFNAWKQARHTQVWGFQSFRCLFVTPSESRIHNMLKSQREVTHGTAGGLFLYTTPQRLNEHGALGPAWISNGNDAVSLIKP